LDVLTAAGASAPPGGTGELVMRRPWPGMFLGVHGDDGTELIRYWDRFPGVYATRDWARREMDGSLTFLGRMDRHVSVSGQLVSLSEVGEVLGEHPFVRDVEMVEEPGGGRGEWFAACVTLVEDLLPSQDLARDLRAHVQEILGGLARPQTIAFVDEFPVDVTPSERRTALRGLCATATDDPAYITASQIRAAALLRG
jgi:acetyl-CoA synthetase